ncbi:hypothetical protein BSR47_04375 [Bradyrhizobium canariense]|nr:hypothetical protein [Bradyrhizobium canariense]OSJ19089.1 hypothetical protein BSR47_04375 [Bradyrhizobium canariense]
MRPAAAQAPNRDPAAHGGADGAERPLVARLSVDQLTDGRHFHILVVVDDCIRECLALVASLSGTWVARELDRLMIERGKSKMVDKVAAH